MRAPQCERHDDRDDRQESDPAEGDLLSPSAGRLRAGYADRVGSRGYEFSVDETSQACI